MTDNSTRDDLINSVHLRAGDTKAGGLFPFSYDTTSGFRHSGEATSALGAMFAPMANHLPVQLESGSGRINMDEGSSTGNAEAIIAGGVIGGTASFFIIFLVLFSWRCHQQKRKGEEEMTKPISFPVHNYLGGTRPLKNHPGLSNHASTPPYIQIGHSQRFHGKRTRNSAPENPQNTAPQLTSSLPELTSSSEAINNANFDFRNEFERLRRDLEEIRATGINPTTSYEPPPQYQTQ
jgi:hypothetical protein